MTYPDPTAGPSYSPPAYEPPTYQPPAYEPPTYPAPPAPRQPTPPQTAAPQPSAPPNYGQPPTAPPNYGPPPTTPPSYGPPSSYGQPPTAPPNYGPQSTAPGQYGPPGQYSSPGQFGPPQGAGPLGAPPAMPYQRWSGDAPHDSAQHQINLAEAASRGKRDITVGAIWFAVGGLITLATMASDATVYVVAWGPMAYGVFRIIKGVLAVRRAG